MPEKDFKNSARQAMVEDVESIWVGGTEAEEERKRQKEREGEGEGGSFT